MENLTSTDQNQLMGYVLSAQTYPVPLPEFWSLCGYPDFRSASAMLERHFQINKDFIEHLGSSLLAYPIYKLTIECAQYLSSMALNEKGNRTKQFLSETNKQFNELPEIHRLSLQAQQTKVEMIEGNIQKLEEDALVKASLVDIDKEIKKQNETMWNGLYQLMRNYAHQRRIPIMEAYEMLFQVAQQNVFNEKN